MRPGPKNSICDIAGLKVGNAEDHKIKTGVTVLLPDAPMTASVHVMGGAPGTRETDLLAPDKTVEEVHALVLSGGSAFGLDAASGVMDALAKDGKGFEVGPARVPIVPAAILFDLINGGDKNWQDNPYRALGLKAYQAAQATFAQGSHGAGTGAIAGTLKGGLGSASLELPSGVTVAALVACNSLGSVTQGDASHFWASPYEIDNEFGGQPPNTEKPAINSTFQTKLSSMDGANTTIAIVATDAALSKPQAHRMAVAAHDGMARAIVPSHTSMDGDLIFSASTWQHKLSDINDLIHICHAASICLSRSIAKAVYAAQDAPGDTVPTWQNRFG